MIFLVFYAWHGINLWLCYFSLWQVHVESCWFTHSITTPQTGFSVICHGFFLNHLDVIRNFFCRILWDLLIKQDTIPKPVLPSFPRAVIKRCYCEAATGTGSVESTEVSDVGARTSRDEHHKSIRCLLRYLATHQNCRRSGLIYWQQCALFLRKNLCQCYLLNNFVRYWNILKIFVKLFCANACATRYEFIVVNGHDVTSAFYKVM